MTPRARPTAPTGPSNSPTTAKVEDFFDYFLRALEMGPRFGSMMTAWPTGWPRWMDEGYYPVQKRLVQGSKHDDDTVFLVDVGGVRGHALEGLNHVHPSIPFLGVV